MGDIQELSQENYHLGAENERLTARIKRLEEALSAFTLFREDETDRQKDDDCLLDIIVSFGDLRRARAALEDK